MRSYALRAGSKANELAGRYNREPKTIVLCATLNSHEWSEFTPTFTSISTSDI